MSQVTGQSARKCWTHEKLRVHRSDPVPPSQGGLAGTDGRRWWCSTASHMILRVGANLKKRPVSGGDTAFCSGGHRKQTAILPQRRRIVLLRSYASAPDQIHRAESSGAHPMCTLKIVACRRDSASHKRAIRNRIRRRRQRALNMCTQQRKGGQELARAAAQSSTARSMRRRVPWHGCGSSLGPPHIAWACADHRQGAGRAGGILLPRGQCGPCLRVRVGVRASARERGASRQRLR